MVDNTNFTNLDFEDVKSKIKTYLKSQSQFQDYDFEGSNMAVLIDILAYNTFMNNFYTNMAFSEMFLDSAQFKDSVVSHAKELNYLPRSRRCARASVNIELFPDDAPATITIPAKTTWTATVGTDFYNFSLRKAINVTPSNGRYLATNATLYEGKWVEEFFTVDGTAEQRFVISNDRIDTTSLRVYVRASDEATTEVEYVLKPNIYDVEATDKVFYLQAYTGNKYEIEFGNDKFGKQPITGNVIRIEYQISSGNETNGINFITASDDIEDYDFTTTLLTRVEGGAERETLESIRFNAPKSIQIQNRAISELDYKNLILTNFPEVKTVSVFGGEKIYPPQFGRVYVAVDTEEFQGVSNNTKSLIEEFLSDKSAIAIEPIIINAKFMYLKVDVRVAYNLNKTGKSAADIKNLVRNAILQYSTDNLEEFAKNFRQSRLVRLIDDADTSIVSNDTTVKSIIKIEPTRNASSYFILQYSNELTPDKTFDTSNLSSYDPCIVSSTFTYAGKTVYLQDNGSGRIDLVENIDGTVYFHEKDIGSVDYTTGDVIIRYITIQDYPSTGILIYARNKYKDINAPVDRILSIRSGDISVTTTTIRE